MAHHLRYLPIRPAAGHERGTIYQLRCGCRVRIVDHFTVEDRTGRYLVLDRGAKLGCRHEHPLFAAMRYGPEPSPPEESPESLF